jgi:PIN domain nuclease of toxin-antitoxin system
MGSDEVIVLDTHTLVWLDQGSERLGKTARQTIDQAFASEGLSVSAISFWEVAVLQSKGRIEMPPLGKWRQELIDMGLIEFPVTGDIGIFSTELTNLHPDPADRLIIATALSLDATLLTADKRILKWGGTLERLDARK